MQDPRRQRPTAQRHDSPVQTQLYVPDADASSSSNGNSPDAMVTYQWETHGPYRWLYAHGRRKNVPLIWIKCLVEAHKLKIEDFSDIPPAPASRDTWLTRFIRAVGYMFESSQTEVLIGHGILSGSLEAVYRQHYPGQGPHEHGFPGVALPTIVSQFVPDEGLIFHKAPMLGNLSPLPWQQGQH